MNKKQAVEKLKIVLNETMQTNWRVFDPTGRDKKLKDKNDYFNEGWLEAINKLNKALIIFQTQYIKTKTKGKVIK